MCLQFVLIKEMETPDGTVTIKQHSELRRMYLQGWIPIDLVSILPFDLAGCLADSDQISKMKVFRIIRLRALNLKLCLVIYRQRAT